MARARAEGIWAVIPVKPFADGKSRLGLGGTERMATNRAFLDHVLVVATTVLPAGNIVVVSRDEAVLTVARRAGTRTLCEPSPGDLNDALAMGARFAGARGASGLLSLFTDLPDLAPADLHAVIAAFTGENLVIAPDARGSGSNALLMAPGALPYRHGPNSLWAHLAAARDAQAPFAIVRRPGLMHDVDTPDQYSAFAQRRSEGVYSR